MSRLLRIAAAFLLIGSFGLLIQGPLCAEGRCPMGQSDAAELCSKIGADCCQTDGDAPIAPAQPTPPGLAPLSEVLPATSAAGTAAHALSTPPAAPAVIQGVGLFTLFAVFLI